VSVLPQDVVPARPVLDPSPADPPDRQRSWWRRWWGSRTARNVTGLVVVLLLVLTTVLLLLGTARSQQADDPRSTNPTGTAALAQLLSDQGVAVSATTRVDEAVASSDTATTLVVANADRLSGSEARRLLDAGSVRMVLVRPNTPALQTFGLAATGVSPADGQLAPGCDQPGAQRAGSIAMSDMRASYRAAAGAELACYPTESGFAHLRIRADADLVDLVAGGLSNDALADEGNASFATTLLGSQPKVVWLMPPRPAGAGQGNDQPTLLPGWWQLAVVQAFVAVLALGLWRGRRLGPILTETLPVTVRASETVEGHGRLYYRLGARDRAAEALRSAARARLGRAFGHRDDPDQLSSVVADRTGRDVRSVQGLLYGVAPDTDDHLRDLAVGLDQLEQEANRL
jgi:hypothetical protein